MTQPSRIDIVDKGSGIIAIFADKALVTNIEFFEAWAGKDHLLVSYKSGGSLTEYKVEEWDIELGQFEIVKTKDEKLMNVAMYGIPVIWVSSVSLSLRSGHSPKVGIEYHVIPKDDFQEAIPSDDKELFG